MKRKFLITAMAAGAILLVGCGSSSTATPSSSDNSAATSSTTSTSTQTATATAAAGDAGNGQKIFSNTCAGCHSTGSDQVVGPGLKGETSKSKLNNGNPMNDDNLKAWIKSGGSGKIGNMPGMSTLSDQQIADVIAYLKTLK